MKRNGTRRLFATLLALIMVLVLLPVGAAKADEEYLAVGGTYIDLTQNGSYCDGKVVFEIIDGKNVLTLNGYKLENYNGNGISADGIDLTIVGSAEIGVTGATAAAISVHESNLTLNGDFTLRAQCQTSTTLYVVGYLTVEGGALDVENSYEGCEAIFVFGSMMVNGGTVHAKANGAKAIDAIYGITLDHDETYLLGDEIVSEVFIGKEYPLIVGGERVNDLNKGDIFGDGTAKFEIIDGRNVLTLNGYKLENYNSSGIYADGIDLTIVGSAEISVTASAIAVNGNLTLNGDFTLRADRQTGAALVVVGNLTVEGGALDVENTYEGNGAISIPGTMTVNGGTVHAKANGTNAIYARIILNNGEKYLLGDAYASEVFIGKQYPLGVGDEQVTDLNKGDIFGDGTAKFEIIDGRNVLTLNDYKLENYNGVGISADGIDLTIVGSAEIGVTGAASSAISVYEGNLTLNGDFTLRAQCENGMPLFLFGYLTVEGGALDVENTGEGSEAIYAHGAMTVNSGTVHAKANGTNAITAYSITLNNGETYLLGDAYASEVKIGVPVEHTVTVVGGTADKTSAKAGDTVTITADDAEYGYAFLEWEMLEDVEFAKGDALTTTFTMPDHDVTVTPVYRAILISGIDDQTYTGEEITLTFGRNDLTLDGVDVALINGTDYSLTYANNVNAGTATVTVTFHDRETKEPDVRMGTKSKTFTILPASIAAAEIAEIVDQTYQGKALTPEPTVTWNGRTLEKDKDYTLQYFNNVNVGTNPYVTVKGKGNFDENTDVGRSFTIIPAPLTITAIDQEYTYNGYPQGEGNTVYATPAEIAQKVTVEGLQGDDKLTSVILDGDATEPKTYPGRIQPSDAVIGNATGTVTGNYEITYVPGTLTIKPCNYTITFVNEDGTELQSGEVLLGKTPAYTGKEPTKPATAQYTYTFAGWKDENGIVYGLTDDLPAVTGEMTYTAIYTSTVNEYTITFVNEDGTVLQEELIAYGETPEYNGETPTKAHTDHYEYTFAGWDPEIVPVTGDATYTAVFTESLLHPIFICGDVDAMDVVVKEGDETLYRYDVTVTDLLDGAVEVNSAQIFLTYDHDKLELKRGEGQVDWTINDADELLSAAWASDSTTTLKNGDVVLTLYFAAKNVAPGETVAIGFAQNNLGLGSALSFVEEGETTEFFAKTQDGSITFAMPDAVTIAGADVLSGDIYAIENGKLLYRYDLRMKDLPEAGLWINSAQIFVEFDHAILALARTEGVFDWTVTENGDKLMAGWASDEDVQINEDDVVLTLWFEKIGEAPEDGRVPIVFTTNLLGNTSAVSIAFFGTVTELETNTVDGSITFEEVVYGDANCDGVVTSADAALILRAIVGLSELSMRGALNADVDGDMEVTAADAALILRYVVGLIDSLPA